VTDQERTEDLAQLLARLKAEYGVNESEIARRIDVAPATVNAWVHRKRGTGRGPNREKLRALAREFPKFTEDEIFSAAGRATPGPLAPDREARALEYFRDLTEQQQRDQLVQMRALGEANKS
jgi:transcriptional regulator with XRE-family HTH domain